MDEDAVQIALGVDDKYFPYAGVLMTSILLNSPKSRIIFHVAVNGSLSKENLIKKEKFNDIYKNAEIKIYDLSDRIAELPELSPYTDKRFNKSILLRIILPEILSDRLKKIIYLDADMLCVGDIKQLWHNDLTDEYIVAACPYKQKHGPEQIKRLGLKSDRYFNSGMLLINMPVWKKKNITNLITDCYNKFYEFFLLPDQDAINIVLQNNIYSLPYKFNRMTAPNDPTLDLREKDDILLHFVNEAKPWIDGNTPVMENLYKFYLNQSVWNDIKFTEPGSVELMILAGRNYEEKGNYEKAAYYYGTTAKRLMEYYLKHNKN